MVALSIIPLCLFVNYAIVSNYKQICIRSVFVIIEIEYGIGTINKNMITVSYLET